MIEKVEHKYELPSNIDQSKLKNLMGPKGLEAFKKAVKIFGSSALCEEEFEGKTGLVIQLRKESLPYVNIVIEEIIKMLEDKYLDKGKIQVTSKRKKKGKKIVKKKRVGKGVLKKDMSFILKDYDTAVAKLFPDYAISGKVSKESYILNELYSRLSGYLLALIGTKENSHKQKKTHQAFFAFIEQAKDRELKPEDDKAFLFPHQYQALQKSIIPFLKGNKFNKFNPLTQKEWTEKELKAENDRIASIILNNQAYEIPICPIDNESLADERYVFKLAPLEPEINAFGVYLAQAGYVEEKYGEELKEDSEMHKKTMAKHVFSESGTEMVLTHAFKGGLDPIFINRFSGNLSVGTFGPESLKLISKDSLAYELIRNDVLWYLAQTICKRSTLEKVFGDIFKVKKEGTKQTKTTTGENLDGKERKMLIFPKGAVQSISKRLDFILKKIKSGVRREDSSFKDDAKDEIEEAKEKKEKEISKKKRIGGHKKLLHLRKKLVYNKETSEYDLIVKATKPSKGALKKIIDTEIKLGVGLELIDIEGGVIYPDEIDFVCKELNLKNIDELISFFEKEDLRVFKRYETWAGKTDDLALTVREGRVKSKELLNRLPI